AFRLPCAVIDHSPLVTNAPGQIDRIGIGSLIRQMAGWVARVACRLGRAARAGTLITAVIGSYSHDAAPCSRTLREAQSAPSQDGLPILPTIIRVGESSAPERRLIRSGGYSSRTESAIRATTVAGQ